MSYLLHTESHNRKIIIYDSDDKFKQTTDEIAVLCIENDGPEINTLILLPIINDYEPTFLRELDVSMLKGELTKNITSKVVDGYVIGWRDGKYALSVVQLIRPEDDLEEMEEIRLNRISLKALKRLELEEPINVQTREGPMKITHICARTDVSYQYFKSKEGGPDAGCGFDEYAYLCELAVYFSKIDTLNPLIVDENV